MTSATLTEISITDIPCDTLSGTGVRRVMVYIRAASTEGGNTVDLSAYVPGAVDVEGVVYETDGGAVEGTSSTWSADVLTLSSGISGAYEGCFVVRTTS